ncbi:OmpA family protein [Desulfatitalea alkaliphila]|uniref:OmpA family protein n=1 Tax=Desulfatitalea alkaliphila TaxID=2929485 RepID=A0AA41R5C1_9BACT|nr:OmpA family protein [Desulfatitalea alkaliphila]MCJ8499493.1 OmpA family protein [Desulfatitalea alkaliphila]
MKKSILIACCLAAMAFNMACGKKSMVMLAPDPDGSVGRITVANEAGSVDIDQANLATVIRSPEAAPRAPEPLDPAKVEALFGQVVANQPLPPLHFRLHFESDSVRLLPDSRRQLTEIVEAIEARSPTRVSVVGHTDTMGDKVYNVQLSLRRAITVRQLLIDRGIDAAFIDVVSHGQENPLVKTPDNVANAQNRRVEVVIR